MKTTLTALALLTLVSCGKPLDYKQGSTKIYKYKITVFSINSSDKSVVYCNKISGKHLENCLGLFKKRKKKYRTVILGKNDTVTVEYNYKEL